MKTKELRQKTDKELNDLLSQNRQKVGQLKFDLAGKKLKNVREISQLRKEVARIMTILTQRQNEPEK